MTTSSGSEGVATPSLQVSLSALSGQPVTVQYAVTGGTAIGGGVDYALPAGALTFALGVKTLSIPLSVVDDNLIEQPETIQVTLSNPTNATLGASKTETYTIRDNDPSVSFLAANSSGQEGTSPASLAVVLSTPATQVVTVQYAVAGGTATGGGMDYSLPAGTLTFNIGESSREYHSADRR